MAAISGHNLDKSPISAWVVFFDEIGWYTLDYSQWLEIAKRLTNLDLGLPSSRLETIANRTTDLNKSIGFLMEVNKVLHERIIDRAAGKSDSGEISGDDSSTTALYRVIQTNVTRFGTLAIVTFLITVLLNFYRYNMRLSAFYLARADAFYISKQDLSDISIIRLVGALSPAIDYGKPPQTPIEQLVSMIQSVSSVDKK